MTETNLRLLAAEIKCLKDAAELRVRQSRGLDLAPVKLVQDQQNEWIGKELPIPISSNGWGKLAKNLPLSSKPKKLPVGFAPIVV
jgi:hypothetical protein